MLRRWWRDTVDSREWVETRKALRATKVFTLASLPEGTFGRITGRVRRLDRLLVTPFLERGAVLYVFAADTADSRVVERVGVPFALEVGERGGDRAVIDPENARVSLSRRRFQQSRGFADPTPRQRDLLDRIVGPGVVPIELPFEEATIEEGDELVVAGFAVREREGEDPTNPYRGDRSRIRIVGTEEHPLLIANDRRLV